MQKTLKCVNIIQNVRGSVQFAEVGEKGQPANDILITVNFKDPKEAAKYEIGREYTFSIDPAFS